MKRTLIFLLLFALVAIIGGGILFVLKAKGSAATPIPTVALLPSLTPTSAPTDTPTPSITPYPSETPTPTSTNTPLPTATFTPSATLATRVFAVTVVNPGVAFVDNNVPTFTPTPLPTLGVPTLPVQVSLPLASTETALGWVRYEDNSSDITWAGKWNVVTSQTTFRATGGSYRYSTDLDSAMKLHFLGAGLRIRYIAASNCGVFEIRVDGKLVRTVDAYYSAQLDKLGAFLSTEVWGLYDGWHDLEILVTDKKNPDSTGYVAGVDAIEVFRTGSVPTEIPQPTIGPSSTPVLAVAQLISAPPTVVPTVVDIPPVNVSVELLIAYDQQGNKIADPNDGVQGISVRLMEAGTNRIVASGMTDETGWVRLSATTNVPLRLICPYLGKFWEVPVKGSVQRIVQLVPPANQPGLIP